MKKHGKFNTISITISYFPGINYKLNYPFKTFKERENLKRIISIFIMSILLATSVTGCFSADESSGSSAASDSSTTSISAKSQQNSNQTRYDKTLSIDQNITNFLDSMSLRQKVGQMVQVEMSYISPEEVKEYGIGSMFAAGGSLAGENRPEDWMATINKYKKAALDSEQKIPLAFGIDAVHGSNFLQDEVIFPHNIGLGASGDAELAGKIAATTANQLKTLGFDWNFSPCVAVSKDIRWGRVYESFGENPDLVTIMSIPIIKNYQENGIIACAKHFAADGAVQYGTGDSGYLIDQGNVDISSSELEKYYLSVYQEAITAGVKSIMVSYSSINGQKNHTNKDLLQNTLKNKMGFKGIVMSDYQGVHQVSGGTLEQKVISAVNAGLDVIMEGEQWRECFEAIVSGVENKYINIQRIDDAVSRVLRVKIEMSMFSSMNTSPTYTLRRQDAIELAQKAVRSSLVLLKNDNSILPLEPNGKIGVIGPAANNIGVQCGGWTKDWQGAQDSGNNNRWMKGTSILEGFTEIASKNGGQIITDVNKLNEADVVVVAIGEYPYAEGKGDAETLTLDGSTALDENMLALKKAYESKRPVVVILVSGRPRIVTDDIGKWSSFVQAWLPGTEGKAIAQVLYGEYQFTGILPVSWPRDDKQLPYSIIDHKNDNVLFSYGYGLGQ